MGKRLFDGEANWTDVNHLRRSKFIALRNETAARDLRRKLVLPDK